MGVMTRQRETTSSSSRRRQSPMRVEGWRLYHGRDQREFVSQTTTSPFPLFPLCLVGRRRQNQSPMRVEGWRLYHGRDDPWEWLTANDNVTFVSSAAEPDASRG